MKGHRPVKRRHGSASVYERDPLDRTGEDRRVDGWTFKKIRTCTGAASAVGYSTLSISRNACRRIGSVADDDETDSALDVEEILRREA